MTTSTTRHGNSGDGDYNNIASALHPHPHSHLQPALVTGAKLKDYQLEGVEWMVSLDKNGVSGILGMSFVPFCADCR